MINETKIKDYLPGTHGSFNKSVYVSLYTAKILKQVGYDEYANLSVTEYITEQKNEQDGTSGPFGWKKGEIEFNSDYFRNNSDSDYSNKNFISYAVPTQAALQKWLREEHGIYVWVTPNRLGSTENSWNYNIETIEFIEYDLLSISLDSVNTKTEKTFEYALEEGLQIGLQELQKMKTNG